MPEAYTHERFARAALPLLGGEMGAAAQACPQAYLLGANGPDILFFHRIWMGGGLRRLTKLGSRMHKTHTAPFLHALFKNARTPAQLAYAAGFVCHYALDSALHPYVRALSAAGGPYAQAGGHGYLECEIDALLYKQDVPAHPTADVPPEAVSPTGMAKAQRAQIALQFTAALQTAYGLALPPRCIRQAIKDMARIKRLLYRPSPAFYGFLARLENLLKLPGQITSHIYPAQYPVYDVLNTAHAPWHAPEAPTAARTEGPQDLTALALQRIAGFFAAAQQAYSGALTPAAFGAALGNFSYESDTPNAGL